MYTDTSIESVGRRNDLHQALMDATNKVIKAETRLAYLKALLDEARQAYQDEHEKSFKQDPI